jgi:hypothetical protein
MEAMLVKIFAMIARSARPDTVKTEFDRTRDQEQVPVGLHAHAHSLRIAEINLDDLITTALSAASILPICKRRISSSTKRSDAGR